MRHVEHGEAPFQAALRGSREVGFTIISISSSLVAVFIPIFFMLYDDRFVFVNGEAIRATGADATLMRRLADERRLDAKSVAQASAVARGLLAEWLRAGWCIQPSHRFDDRTPT